MSLNFELKEGAFIVADAHYSSHHNPQLKNLFEDIDAGRLQPTQLILAGDIFDALFKPIPYTIKANEEVINLLNKISKKIETIYLEGNHDFALQGIFQNIKIYPLELQPVKGTYAGKSVMLAHGDFGEAPLYKIYTRIIRNRFVLFLLKYIDLFGGHFILKRLNRYLQTKDDCREFTGFEKYVKRRLQDRYLGQCDIFIEGHFHQDVIFHFDNTTYINLPAFACNQRYFIVKSSSLMEKDR
jgi:UDP-2,3-diacylglucosamine hydrolase